MYKRIASGTAWTLFFATSLLATGSFSGGLEDKAVALCGFVLGGTSVLLFWVSGACCGKATSA